MSQPSDPPPLGSLGIQADGRSHYNTYLTKAPGHCPHLAQREKEHV